MNDQETVKAISEACADLARRTPRRDELRSLVESWERSKPLQECLAYTDPAETVRMWGGIGGAWA